MHVHTIMYYWVGVAICSVCLIHISMTFEPTDNMCALLLLLVGMASTLGMVGHVQQQVWQSLRRMAKHMFKEFQKMSKVSNTSPKARTWSFLETAAMFASLAAAFSYLSILPQTSRASGYILDLCLCFSFRISLLAHSFSLSSQFLSILMLRQWGR